MCTCYTGVQLLRWWCSSATLMFICYTDDVYLLQWCSSATLTSICCNEEVCLLHWYPSAIRLFICCTEGFHRLNWRCSSAIIEFCTARIPVDSGSVRAWTVLCLALRMGRWDWVSSLLEEYENSRVMHNFDCVICSDELTMQPDC